MSNTPFSNINTPNQDQDSHDQFLSPDLLYQSLDDSSWPLFQEILMQLDPVSTQDQLTNDNPTGVQIEIDNSSLAVPHGDDVPAALMPQMAGETTLSLDKGLKSMRISKSDSKKRKKNTSRLTVSNNVAEKITPNHDHVLDDEGVGPSVAKKLHHNAKERIRRMKLNASYLALRALLPDSRRSKKRWSAPSIVDRALKYIPELENEIEALKSKKETMQLSAAKKKKIIDANDDDQINPSSQYQQCTISVNEINHDEAIVQICMPRSEECNVSKSAFADLLQHLEDDESIINIKTVSSLDVCESRICFHLHIQIRQSSSGSDHIVELRHKLTSWLQ